jgi:3-oxoacyl-[acyl-carrier protein] reductase
MNLDLAGKKALVTGGTHGVGKAISESLAMEGVSVAFLSRSDINLREQSEFHQQIGNEFIALKCDVLNPSEIESSWTKIKNQWGGVDIVVNNVGGGGRWGFEDITKTPLNTWNEVMQKNFGVATHLTNLALPFMIEKQWGRVITITSIFGNYVGGRPWFNVAKVAQTALMKNLASQVQFARNGITFNCIAPGAILIPDTGWTKMQVENPEEYKQFIDSLPLGRMGMPEEVADLVLFLSSDKSKLINGASIVIDGGETSNLF